MNINSLIAEYRESNKSEILEEIINQNIGLIKKIARKYEKVASLKLIEFDELVNEGVIAVIRCVSKYDSEINSKFSTYCNTAIICQVLDYINGRGEKEKYNRELISKTESFSNEFADELTLEDILGAEDTNLKFLMDRIILENLHNELEALMKEELTQEGEAILKLRFGWNCEEMMKFTEIAQILNTNSNHIYFVYSRALRKLRKTEWAKLRGVEFLLDIS